MATPINPVVSGIMQGFQLAHAIKGERLNQQALEQQKQRDEENTQVRDLQTRMSMADRGYKPSTPDQDAEIATGQGIGPIKPPGGDGALVPGTTVQGPVPSDIKTRLAKFKGDTYVRDSDAVIAGKQRKLAAQTLSDKLAEKQGEEDIKTRGKKQQSMDQFNTMGVPITDAMADKAGLPHGSRIMQGPGFQGALGQLIKSNQPPPASKVSKSFLTREGGGNVTSVLGDGTVKVSDSLGLPDQAPKRAAGSLTDYQSNQIDRQKQQDAIKAQAAAAKEQKAAQKEVDALEQQMQALHEQNRQIGETLIAGSKGTAKNAKGKQIKVSAEDAASLKSRLADNQTKVKSLFDRQHGIIMKFAGGGQAATPAAAAAPAATAAPGAQPKIASGDQVNAYAKQKGITPEQAQQEFQQSGYTVQ